MLGNRAPKFTVWHCPVRAAPEDPILTDDQWADIAHRIVAAAGIAPDGDPEACRWVAVRHADDHIHIAATLVRQDGRRPKRDYDIRAVQRKPGDGTAAKHPTSKEHFKAKRLGQDATSREILRLRVRRAMAAASVEAEFFALLEATGVKVRPKSEPSGDVTGYSVSLPGDVDKQKEPIWYADSTLASDLSLSKIHQRLATTAPEPVAVRPGKPGHQGTAATETSPITSPTATTKWPKDSWPRLSEHSACSRSLPRPKRGPNSNGPPSPSSVPPAPASPPTTPAPAPCAAASR